MVDPRVTYYCNCQFYCMAEKYHQPKPTVAVDGVQMPAEKVEPLVDTSRTGGSYSAAVKVAAPAVVNIVSRPRKLNQNHPLLSDPVFREFFEIRFLSNKQQNENSLEFRGLLFRADGYILTNAIM